MRIAVSCQNGRSINAHPGKTRRFLVFEAGDGRTPAIVDRIELTRDQTLHEMKGATEHPLFTVDAVISGSAGEGFTRRLGNRGIRVATTSETDPEQAVRMLLDGTLPPAAPHDH